MVGNDPAIFKIAKAKQDSGHLGVPFLAGGRDVLTAVGLLRKESRVNSFGPSRPFMTRSGLMHSGCAVLSHALHEIGQSTDERRYESICRVVQGPYSTLLRINIHDLGVSRRQNIIYQRRKLPESVGLLLAV